MNWLLRLSEFGLRVFHFPLSEQGMIGLNGMQNHFSPLQKWSHLPLIIFLAFSSIYPSSWGQVASSGFSSGALDQTHSLADKAQPLLRHPHGDPGICRSRLISGYWITGGASNVRAKKTELPTCWTEWPHSLSCSHGVGLHSLSATLSSQAQLTSYCSKHLTRTLSPCLQHSQRQQLRLWLSLGAVLHEGVRGLFFPSLKNGRCEWGRNEGAYCVLIPNVSSTSVSGFPAQGFAQHSAEKSVPSTHIWPGWPGLSCREGKIPAPFHLCMSLIGKWSSLSFSEQPEGLH